MTGETAIEEQEFEVPLDANQVVAHNLARARALRGWTQEQAAELLEEHLGVRWSKSSWSTAERSAGGGRVKKFDAEEIIAFSHTFKLPVAWFFLPPGPERLDISREFQATILIAQFGGGAESVAPYIKRTEELLSWCDLPSYVPSLIYRTILDRAEIARELRGLVGVRETLSALLGAIDTIDEEMRSVDEEMQSDTETED